jgi:hypothetical protein
MTKAEIFNSDKRKVGYFGRALGVTKEPPLLGQGRIQNLSIGRGAK